MSWRQSEPAPVTPGNQAPAKKMSFGEPGSPSAHFLGRARLGLGRTPDPGWGGLLQERSLPGFQKCECACVVPLCPTQATQEGREEAPICPGGPKRAISLFPASSHPRGPGCWKLERGRGGACWRPELTCGAVLPTPASPSLEQGGGWDLSLLWVIWRRGWAQWQPDNTPS